jgi:phospholipase C
MAGQESNPDSSQNRVSVYKINPADPAAYFMPGADPGEGYANEPQLFGSGHAPVPPAATNQGFVTNFDATIAWDQRVGRNVCRCCRRRVSCCRRTGWSPSRR